MCGIFGLYNYNNQERRQDIPELCSNLINSLSHRGPDAQQCVIFDQKNNWSLLDDYAHENTHCFLGHTRLSVLDLNKTSDQPMFDESEQFCLVFNGEIYNYLELREELILEGVFFNTNSDTEVLLKGYIFWGEDILDKIIGMFAFVIYDLKKQEIFAVRDHFGIKPFFYSISQGTFVFASEINTMFEFPQVSRTLNSQKAYQYLHFFGASDNDGATMLKDISQIEPGHYIKISHKKGNIEHVKYWDVEDYAETKPIPLDEAIEKVKELFITSVKIHLRSDVPIGITLSGGIDSSAIVSVVRELNPDNKINTFSFLANDKKICEKQWIDKIVDHVSATSHPINLTENNLIYDLNKLVSLQGEPFASTSIFAQYKVFQEAKNKEMTVLLDGQGADEIFSGYEYHIGDYIASCLRQLKFKPIWAQLKSSKNYPDRNYKLIIMKSLFNFLPHLLYPLVSRVIGNPVTPGWVNNNWLIQSGIDTKPLKVNHSLMSRNFLKNNLIYRLKTTGLRRLLRYEDRNSMAFSLESRVPFLYKPLVEYVMSLPEEYLIDDKGMTKSIFRKAMEDIVPNNVLYRKDKIGFQTPENKWLLENYNFVLETLRSAKDIPIFNHLELLNQWKQMYKENKIKGGKVWLWISFILWYKQFNIKL